MSTKPVTCNECGEEVKLVAHEDASGTDYTVECGCEMTAIDVSPVVNGNNLLEPLYGQWSMLND